MSSCPIGWRKRGGDFLGRTRAPKKTVSGRQTEKKVCWRSSPPSYKTPRVPGRKARFRAQRKKEGWTNRKKKGESAVLVGALPGPDYDTGPGKKGRTPKEGESSAKKKKKKGRARARPRCSARASVVLRGKKKRNDGPARKKKTRPVQRQENWEERLHAEN